MGKKGTLILYIAIALFAIVVPVLVGTKVYASDPDTRGDEFILVLDYQGESSEY